MTRGPAGGGEDALELYDYDLPPELIAQEPAPERDASRLLVVERDGGAMTACRFPEIARRLREGDLLVVNDVRVFPARVRVVRAGGGDAEVLLLEPLEPPEAAAADADRRLWEAIVRPARWARALLRRGEPIALGAGDRDDAGGGEAASAELRREVGEGRFAVALRRGGELLDPEGVIALCEELGEMPLPPYIRRGAGDPRRAADRERYQTVYAREPGAVAAPTAGLHFTPDVLAALEAAGIERVAVTHQVGIGTFQPIRAPTLDAHGLHAELSSISAAAGGRILAARESGRRIVAVGTTTVRALESFALAGCPLPFRASTDLFIRPGHRFRLVDALLTNFHLPRSSLLVLVSAFAGREPVLSAYRRAIAEGFRFYSYGDAMLVL